MASTGYVWFWGAPVERVKQNPDPTADPLNTLECWKYFLIFSFRLQEEAGCWQFAEACALSYERIPRRGCWECSWELWCAGFACFQLLSELLKHVVKMRIYSELVLWRGTQAQYWNIFLVSLSDWSILTSSQVHMP